MDLESTKNTVFNIISEMPNSDTINDYFLLYLEVLKRKGIDTSLSIEELFSNHSNYDLPTTEAVSRTKRYWREIYPEKFRVKDEAKEEEYKNKFAFAYMEKR